LRRRIVTALAELGAAPPLAAIVLLAANDRVFKRAFHNAVTGKLSDVAICFLLPLLVSAVLGLMASWSAPRRLWLGAAITAAVFSLLEMSDTAGALFARAMAPLGFGDIVLTRDPTDLLALFMVVPAVAYGRRRVRLPAARPGAAVALGAVVLVGGSWMLMATSAVRCGLYSAPVVFQVEPGCGPGGLIVVSADPQLAIANARALGLPALGSNGVQAYYHGQSCPATVDRGEWQVMVAGCPDGGAASDADAGAVTCATSARTCDAAIDGDQLWFTCTDAGGTVCRSRLTEMP